MTVVRSRSRPHSLTQLLMVLVKRSLQCGVPSPSPLGHLLEWSSSLMWYNHLVLPVVFLTRDTCIQGRLVLISLPGQLVTNSCGDQMKPTLLQDRNVHEDYKIIYLRLSLFIESDKQFYVKTIIMAHPSDQCIGSST